MQLAKRLELLVQLQSYMLSNDAGWQAVKEKAYTHNGWFIPQFIDLAAKNIATYLLTRTHLQHWITTYNIPGEQQQVKTIGIIMPGNIPMTGFYDFLCVFLSGHRQRIKLSPTDDVLLKHLVNTLAGWDSDVHNLVSFDDMLKGCDAYLTTENRNTKALEKYYNKYPHIIHSNATSVALLTGEETRQQLELLADDVFQYFGQGCLNVNKVFVPKDYDFIPLLKAFDKYGYLIDHNKYKNNYDYQLAMLILNKEFYMTNGSILLTENASHSAPIARLHYEYYSDADDV
ncbi:MAG TPA: acyl-CoA reductase, partial [Chitinophagaceae bacterium]|nr:acyl-CoA reductase [Chitinophagaceae bacterium]